MNLFKTLAHLFCRKPVPQEPSPSVSTPVEPQEELKPHHVSCGQGTTQHTLQLYQRICGLRANHSYDEIAEILNREGVTTVQGKKITGTIVNYIIRQGKRRESGKRTQKPTRSIHNPHHEKLKQYTAELYKQVAELRAAKLTYDQIAEELNRRGVKTATGQVFKRYNVIDVYRRGVNYVSKQEAEQPAETIKMPEQAAPAQMTPSVYSTEALELIEAYQARKQELGVPYLSQALGYSLYKRLLRSKAFANWTELVRAAGDTPYKELDGMQQKQVNEQTRQALIARGIDSCGNPLPNVEPVAEQPVEQPEPVPVVQEALPIEEIPQRAQNVLAQAPVDPFMRKEYYRRQFVTEYKTLREKIGRQPTTLDAKAFYHKLAKQGLTWEEIVQDAGDVPFNKQPVKTIEQLVDMGCDLFEQLGYLPYPKDPAAGQLYRELKRNHLVTWDQLVTMIKQQRQKLSAAKAITQNLNPDLPPIVAAKQKLIEDFIKLELKLGRTPNINDASTIFSQVMANRFWKDWDVFKADVRRHQKQELIHLLIASRMVTGLWPVPSTSKFRAWNSRTVTSTVALPLPERFLDFWPSLEEAALEAAQYMNKKAV